MSSTYTQPFVFSNTDTTIDPETEITTSVTTKATLLDFNGISLSKDLNTTPIITTINADGFDRDGADVTFSNLYNLKLATPALRIPATPNVFLLENSVQVEDETTAVTRLANLSAVASLNPQLTLKADTGGAVWEEADLTQNGVSYIAPAGTTTTRTWTDILNSSGSTNTLQQILDNGNTATGANAKIALTNSGVGGSANPQLTLTNTNDGNEAVVLEVFKDKGIVPTNGDVLFQQSVYGEDSFLNKQEYTRITHTIRDITGGAEDGSIEMGCMVNGAFANFLQLNGNQNEVNCLKTLDMGGHTIRTTTGDMTIQTTSSSGGGDIAITGKSGSIMSLSATLMNITSNGGANLNLNANTGVVACVGSALTFNTINIIPRQTYNTFAFSVSGSPSGTILNFGVLADMVANTTWKVDVGFYTGDGVNNRSVITYVVQDTMAVFVEQNSVFGYTQGGLQTPITYDPIGTPMGKYCSFTDTFFVSNSAVGACSFILTGGTSDGSTWSGTCRVSIVLTRLS